MEDISIFKNHAGALELSAIIYGHRVAKTYYFYSRRSALADFKQYLRGYK
jgi:hypothetical protein